MKNEKQKNVGQIVYGVSRDVLNKAIFETEVIKLEKCDDGVLMYVSDDDGENVYESVYDDKEGAYMSCTKAYFDTIEGAIEYHNRQVLAFAKKVLTDYYLNVDDRGKEVEIKSVEFKINQE